MASNGTRDQNEGASASAYSWMSPVCSGSGRFLTISGVNDSAPAPPSGAGAPAKTPSSLVTSREVKTALNSAMPTAPISRKKLWALVPSHRERGATTVSTW